MRRDPHSLHTDLEAQDGDAALHRALQLDERALGAVGERSRSLGAACTRVEDNGLGRS